MPWVVARFTVNIPGRVGVPPAGCIRLPTDQRAPGGMPGAAGGTPTLPGKLTAHEFVQRIHPGVIVPGGGRGEQPLAAFVGREAALDFGVGGARSLEITLVDDDEIGHIEHGDLLQLQTAAVVGVHDEDPQVDEITGERQGFLAGAHGFDDDEIELAAA